MKYILSYERCYMLCGLMVYTGVGLQSRLVSIIILEQT